ncbi:MAG: T9SS C-terminal target domain-containing protein [Chitinophagaceae bacterium]|nr:MAG: T9SS C-terminal target domain-containing protein [Chitinophagaceae bacterium]
MNCLQTFFLMLFLFFSFGVANAQTVVVLELQDPCATVSVEETLQQKQSFQLDIFPNPANDRIVVKASSGEQMGKIKIQLINLNGAVILSEELFSENNAFMKTFNISHLPRGTYIMNLFKGTEKTSRKVIIN